MIGESTKNRVVFTLAVATGLGMLSLFSGCMSLEEMAPPVEARFQMVASRQNVDTATLELGREIYLSDCVKCHGVEPIGRYSAEHWREIMPRMTKESKLNAQRSEAVRAYVTLAHMLLAEIAEAETGGEIAKSRE